MTARSNNNNDDEYEDRKLCVLCECVYVLLDTLEAARLLMAHGRVFGANANKSNIGGISLVGNQYEMR